MIRIRTITTTLLRRMPTLRRDIEDLHALTCASRCDTYPDPDTGYSVFTADSHFKRAKCCGAKCRHCPFGHINAKQRVLGKYLSPVLLSQTGARRWKFPSPAEGMCGCRALVAIPITAQPDQYRDLKQRLSHSITDLLTRIPKKDSLCVALLMNFDSSAGRLVVPGTLLCNDSLSMDQVLDVAVEQGLNVIAADVNDGESSTEIAMNMTSYQLGRASRGSVLAWKPVDAGVVDASVRTHVPPCSTDCQISWMEGLHLPLQRVCSVTSSAEPGSASRASAGIVHAFTLPLGSTATK